MLVPNCQLVELLVSRKLQTLISWQQIAFKQIRDTAEAGVGYVAFEGVGIPDSTEWQPETSLLILGIDEDTAAQIGLEFDQNAIVFGWHGEVAELIECKGR